MISLAITIVFTIVGIILTLLDVAYWVDLARIGVVFSLGFVIPGLNDVYRNRKYGYIEKMMWIIGFIFLSWIAGIAYLNIYKRNRLVAVK